MLAARVATEVFADRLASEGLATLRRGPVRTLQVNVTRRCNLACLYDCDFHLALDLRLLGSEETIWDVDDLRDLEGRPIATAEHCFGCTAGGGSSCGGTLV